jgi:DNA-binding response OmpR family regulator
MNANLDIPFAADKPAPTVLMVEGEVLIRVPVAAYLRECGLTVMEAASTDEARELLHSSTGIGVTIINLESAGSVSGFALAQWMRASRPGMRILLSSSVARLAQQAHRLCEDSIFSKPYDRHELEQRIRRLLAQ